MIDISEGPSQDPDMCSCAAKMLSHTNTLMFNDNKSDVRTTPLNVSPYTAQKMNFCIKDVFSKS